MKLSQLFTRTIKENPKDEVSINAQLLERGGFVYKNSAGIYSFLPLGWRIMQKISDIIRQEMNAVGGQEIFMPALIEKKYLDVTDRWNVDVGFDAYDKEGKPAGFVLGWSHEDILTAMTTKYISSYKDLPFAAYQIQTKFRNEPRAKSGLLRGREFMMKDLYSFHTTENDLYRYYEEVKAAYHKIFNRCGLNSIYTLAAGGVFTASNTHEFQVVSPVGEDTIFVCSQCDYAENNEISKLKGGDKCPKCGGSIKEEKSIEVGNIFPLGTKYSKPYNLHYINEKGEKEPVVMGSYGIGVGRLMATVVEVHHDDRGIIWPESISPFDVHLIVLDDGSKSEADKVYDELQKKGVGVLYDDREDKMAGEKFADADLIGVPTRLVVSKKTLADQKIELKKRTEKDSKLLDLTKYLEVI